MKLAVVTPWPDDRSGIADYAYSLVAGLLKESVNVVVFTQSGRPTPLPDATIINSDYREWNLKEFDVLVYQMGNNLEFHGYMLDLLEKFPGVVHLHDFVLQDLFAAHALRRDQWPAYFEAITRFYGPSTGQRAQQSFGTRRPFWERADIIRFPLCERVLEPSAGFIVHSAFVHDEIRRRLPNLPGIIVPQVYPDEPAIITSKSASEFKIGVFGHLQPNRCIDVLLKALHRLESQGRSVIVRMVGPVLDPSYNERLQRFIQAVEGKAQIEILGYVSHPQFLEEIAACDVCVSLRNPTLGETSAVVTRSLKLGKPTIVTRVGWYAELPDCVLKIAPGSSGVDELAAILNRLISDDDYLRQIQSETARFARRDYDFSKAVRRYQEALHAFYHIAHTNAETKLAPTFVLDPLIDTFRDLGIDTPYDEEGIRAFTYRKLDVFFQR